MNQELYSMLNAYESMVNFEEILGSDDISIATESFNFKDLISKLWNKFITFLNKIKDWVQSLIAKLNIKKVYVHGSLYGEFEKSVNGMVKAHTDETVKCMGDLKRASTEKDYIIQGYDSILHNSNYANLSFIHLDPANNPTIANAIKDSEFKNYRELTKSECATIIATINTFRTNGDKLKSFYMSNSSFITPEQNDHNAHNNAMKESYFPKYIAESMLLTNRMMKYFVYLQYKKPTGSNIEPLAEKTAVTLR